MAVVERKRSSSVHEVSKSIIIAMNGFMILISIIIIALSLWTLSESRGFFVNGFYVTTGVFLLLSGLGSLLISSIAIHGIVNGSKSNSSSNTVGGHFSSLKNIRPFIYLSMAFFSFFLSLSLISIIISFIFRHQFSQGNFREKLYESTRSYTDSYFIQYSWDILQSRFKCCGLVKPPPSGGSNRDNYGYVQFSPSMVWSMLNPEFRKPNGPRVPESCCDESAIGKFANFNAFRMACQGRKYQIYREDCYFKLENSLWPRIDTISFAAVAMAILAMIGIFFCWILLKTMAKSEGVKGIKHGSSGGFDPNKKVSNSNPLSSSNSSPTGGTKFNVDTSLAGHEDRGRKPGGGIFSNERSARVDDSFKRTSSFDPRNPPNINSWQK